MRTPANLYGSILKPIHKALTLRTVATATDTPTPPRLLPIIKQEHREIHAHSHRILHSASPDEQTRYQNLFTWELARHVIGEELVVYPAIAAHVKNGFKVVSRNRAEHHAIKEQLKVFQGLPSTDPRFAAALEELMGDLTPHMQREESEDFVALEEALSEGESEEIARVLDRTKAFVPSRSHPLAPVDPPFHTVAGLLTAPLDMIADLFRKWPHSRDEGGR
ncbi:hypothetical protein N7470_002395 [Penicillium chermesinum]|nr:hypothetical protein N7470_002395 [Penicillium chermesinum]